MHNVSLLEGQTICGYMVLKLFLKSVPLVGQWWHLPLLPAPRQRRADPCEFQASQHCTGEPCLEKPNQTEQTKHLCPLVSMPTPRTMFSRAICLNVLLWCTLCAYKGDHFKQNTKGDKTSKCSTSILPLVRQEGEIVHGSHKGFSASGVYGPELRWQQKSVATKATSFHVLSLKPEE